MCLYHPHPLICPKKQNFPITFVIHLFEKKFLGQEIDILKGFNLVSFIKFYDQAFFFKLEN
jgi:hypothetical protein